jgi:O-antigen/teichoic acid export membrane protein
MINIGFTSVAAVLFPKAINQDLKTSYRMSIRALVASLMLAVPAAVVLLFFARIALRLLYGREYAIATGLLKILILEAILSGCITVMSQTFMAIGRPGTVTLLQSAGLATAIPLVAFLVPRFGSEGAGFALVISALIRGFLLWLSYRKLLPDPGAPMYRQMWTETQHVFRTHGAPLMRWLLPARNPTD